MIPIYSLLDDLYTQYQARDFTTPHEKRETAFIIAYALMEASDQYLRDVEPALAIPVEKGQKRDRRRMLDEKKEEGHTCPGPYWRTDALLKTAEDLGLIMKRKKKRREEGGEPVSFSHEMGRAGHFYYKSTFFKDVGTCPRKIDSKGILVYGPPALDTDTEGLLLCAYCASKKDRDEKNGLI